MSRSETHSPESQNASRDRSEEVRMVGRMGVAEVTRLFAAPMNEEPVYKQLREDVFAVARQQKRRR